MSVKEGKEEEVIALTEIILLTTCCNVYYDDKETQDKMLKLVNIIFKHYKETQNNPQIDTKFLGRIVASYVGNGGDKNIIKDIILGYMKENLFTS